MDEVVTVKPPLEMIDCIVMYGGGLTSYEASKRAIEKYGHDAVDIWFADTRTEDEDLYRFNRDVEKILNHPIKVFSQGLDIWEIFERERFLGNSRIDPCSKFLKRMPLRKALERAYPNWGCVICGSGWNKRNGERISVLNIDMNPIVEPICLDCQANDDEYRTEIEQLQQIIDEVGEETIEARIKIRNIANRIERCSDEGRFVRVVLGMDIIEDCDRLHRAEAYWKPFINWFPLAELPIKNKSQIIDELRSMQIREPRLYTAGFAHNNCGGFCVKAGIGQMVHLYKTMPERYLYHEKKELDFQKFIGAEVSILSQTVNGEKKLLTLHSLRKRVEAGEEFRFNKSNACACLNPETPDLDELPAW